MNPHVQHRIFAGKTDTLANKGVTTMETEKRHHRQMGERKKKLFSLRIDPRIMEELDDLGGSRVSHIEAALTAYLKFQKVRSTRWR